MDVTCLIHCILAVGRGHIWLLMLSVPTNLHFIASPLNCLELLDVYRACVIYVCFPKCPMPLVDRFCVLEDRPLQFSPIKALTVNDSARRKTPRLPEVRPAPCYLAVWAPEGGVGSGSYSALEKNLADDVVESGDLVAPEPSCHLSLLCSIPIFEPVPPDVDRTLGVNPKRP